MTQALNLALFANKLNTSGQTDNTGLQNSSLTVTAGTGMSGGGSVALGGTTTLTNAGVTSIVAGAGVTISGPTGAVTVNASGLYNGPTVQAFTSSGTFTVPTGITKVRVSVIGGGGGGASLTVVGGGGGNSSFGSSVIGGGGSGGGTPFVDGIGDCQTTNPNNGGTSTNVPYELTTLRLKGNYGTAGGGSTSSTPQGCFSGGGENTTQTGKAGVGYVTGLTPGANITVTVGAGGTSSGGNGSTAGTAGVVIVEW